MKPRKQRMIFVAVIFVSVAVAATLVLMSLGENMMYFYSPSQVHAGEVPHNAKIRIGGLVVKGSVERAQNSLDIKFDLTDTVKQVTVYYTGILPDLFREGQGIVAIGKLDGDSSIRAETVLAKHVENYMPPEVSEAIKTAAEGGTMPIPASHNVK